MGFVGCMRNSKRCISSFKHKHTRDLCSISTNINGQDQFLPVLIVGAGPVGLVLATLLTKLGIKCAVVEKNKSFSNHPQAHFINNRTMEIFRKLDGLAEEIQTFQPPVELWRKFIYCSSLSGAILGSVDHMQPQDFEQVISPISVAHYSQYKLTRLLLKKLETLNFNFCNAEGFGVSKHEAIVERQILMGHECVSIESTNDCVSITVSFFHNGQYTERNIQCGVLVGADGAGSTVRKLTGISLKGEKDMQKLISIHFISRALGNYLLNERPGMLFFIFNTQAIGVLVAHDLKEGEFVLQIPFYPPQQKPEDFTYEMCERLIFQLVGKELADVNVMDIKPWVMHGEVAEKFVSHGSRIILVGDAAHRFPPAGGFGMNTGIQDAHNLAWKLASVIRGISSFSVLQTYETERRPIAKFNTALSIQNFRAAMEVPAALGLDPVVANSLHQVINHGLGSILPSGLQKSILDGLFAIGRAQLSDMVLNESNPLGSARLFKLRRIFEEGKSLQLQFPAEDLGFRYLQGALVPDKTIHHDSTEKITGRRREYIPSADPGSRLPHMNIKELSKWPSEEIFSTLDLVAGDKLEFLLIIAPVLSSYDLARATFEVADEFKVSAKVCIMWPHGSATELEARTKSVLVPWKNYIDVVEVKGECNSSSWWDICRMTDEGAILVRPDEHIAWRMKSKLVRDPVSEMKRVFSTVLKVNSIQN